MNERNKPPIRRAPEKRGSAGRGSAPGGARRRADVPERRDNAYGAGRDHARHDRSAHAPAERHDSEGVDPTTEAAALGVIPKTEALPRRRSLTNVGGGVETSGDRAMAQVLAHALDVAPSMDEGAEDRAHVHGFHAYPARAHPVTVRRLIEDLVPPGGTVLDPFCGSGTVLVEAMLAGRATIGSDLNPIAVMLARAKTFPRGQEKTAALVEAACGVADYADARRKAKSGASRRLPQEDVSLFPPHVLLELDGLRAGIAEAPPEMRPELALVLSSILVKLSPRRGDTSEAPVEKRIAAGYPSRLFVRKTEELARRFDDFATLLRNAGAASPHARVYEDDATVLRKVRGASIDAVITSPPYVATYDYLQHHELRMRWLGLDARKLARGEIGARRNYERLSAKNAMASWEGELGKLFHSLARVMKKGAPLVLLIADSAAGRGPGGERAEPIRADDVVARVAEQGGELAPIARASQARPHFHGPTRSAFTEARPRFEHALLLRRS
ncbi:MAG TPA: DNA methyltransferase [Labilithrix sp.]|nr:DNA methyltransferase [Labilithrix sp.]